MNDTARNAALRALTARGLVVLALVAAAIASYLSWVAWSQRGLPLGCGEYGGCAEVLTSRWSAVAGIPIGLIALPLYLVAGASVLRVPAPWAIRTVSFAGAALVAGAVWFVGLQMFVLRAFCLWCLVEHALGLAMAGLAAVTLGSVARAGAHSGVGGGMMLGALSVMALAAVQVAQPAARSIVRSPGGAAVTETTDGPTIGLLQGHLRIAADDDNPRLGAADAPRRLYLLFDYCCPHCRRAHEYLLDGLALHGDRFSVVCLPAPRDADCNDQLRETEARFEHACELALLALAVWRAQPDAFAEFDRWLFAPTQPPHVDTARHKAIELVGSDALDTQLAGDELRSRIARNVKAFNDSRVEYLPVMMAPGMDTIVGRPESREALLAILAQELFPSERIP